MTRTSAFKPSADRLAPGHLLPRESREQLGSASNVLEFLLVVPSAEASE
jgi:hypothetical protein